jgi:hypothetical protein
MKRLLFLLVTTLIVGATALSAQPTDKYDADRKEIKQYMEQFAQLVLINQNIDAITDFYPKKGKTNYIYNQKLEESTLEDAIKSVQEQFKNIKYTRYEILEEPFIHFTDDGRTALVFSSEKYDFETLKDHKSGTVSYSGLSVYIKENGKWYSILDSFEPKKANRQVAVLEPALLDEYSGMYVSEENGTICEVSNNGRNLIFTTQGGLKYTYIPQTECAFYMKDQPQTIVFGRDKNGEVSYYTTINENACTVAIKMEDVE